MEPDVGQLVLETANFLVDVLQTLLNGLPGLQAKLHPLDRGKSLCRTRGRPQLGLNQLLAPLQQAASALAQLALDQTQASLLRIGFGGSGRRRHQRQ